MKNTIGNLGRAFVVAVALTASQAIGQVIHSATQSIDFTVAGNESTQTLSFLNFDTSLGTLESVTIWLDNVHVSGTASITNQDTGSGQAYTYQVALNGDYTLTDTTGNVVDVTVATNRLSSGSLAVGNTYTTPSASNATAGTAQTVLTAGVDDVSSYQGDGQTELTLTLDGLNYVTVPRGNGFYQVTSNLSGTGSAKITYTYSTPVETPEPSTVAFLAVAAIGGAFFAARRRFVQA